MSTVGRNNQRIARLWLSQDERKGRPALALTKSRLNMVAVATFSGGGKSSLDKNIYVGVYRSSFSQMSRSKGLRLLRAATEPRLRNLWTPFVVPGWHSECFDRLFAAMGFEDWRGSSESLFRWQGSANELIAIRLCLDSDHKIAAVLASPDDFSAVRDAVTLLVPDSVEYEFSVCLRDGVENSGGFGDFTIISSREPPPPGLEELQPVGQEIDRLLEGAAKTVMARVKEQQHPAFAEIRNRFDRF
jgi:hypothetical protein